MAPRTARAAARSAARRGSRRVPRRRDQQDAFVRHGGDCGIERDAEAPLLESRPYCPFAHAIDVEELSATDVERAIRRRLVPLGARAALRR